MSVEYALKGVVTSVFLAIIVTPLYLLSQLSASDKWLLVEAASVIIVGYVGLVTMGMVGEIVWRRVKAQHERVTGHTPFENWGEETDD